MTKFFKQSAVRFAAVAAVCAFAMPSVASAASWGPVGTEHTLDSANLGFTAISQFIGPITSSCSSSSLTARVTNAAVLTITGVSFLGCTTVNPTIGTCTTTWTATGLPWSATAITTTTVQIHAVRFDVIYENSPGSTSCLKDATGIPITVTGTIDGGQWNPGSHEVLFSNASGLVSDPSTTLFTYAGPAPLRGTFRDTQQSLTVT